MRGDFVGSAASTVGWEAERGEMTEARRVALVANTSFYVGPALARELSQLGHDLVVGDPGDGLVEELTERGARSRW